MGYSAVLALAILGAVLTVGGSLVTAGEVGEIQDYPHQPESVKSLSVLATAIGCGCVIAAAVLSYVLP